jgi:hypothetical protein
MPGQTPCAPGLPCVVDSWCRPTLGAACHCDGGVYICGKNPEFTDKVLVCVDKLEPACDGPAEAGLNAKLNSEFLSGCPDIHEGPTEMMTSSGVLRCCYVITSKFCPG